MPTKVGHLALDAVNIACADNRWLYLYAVN